MRNALYNRADMPILKVACHMQLSQEQEWNVHMTATFAAHEEQ